jgi:predicted transcriptional regulator
MPSLTASPSSFWDDVDYGILCAAQSPATCREIADRAGLTPDVVKNQIDVHVRVGLLVKTVDGGVRYGLTVAGYKRRFELAAALTRPGHQAAA